MINIVGWQLPGFTRQAEPCEPGLLRQGESSEPGLSCQDEPGLPRQSEPGVCPGVPEQADPGHPAHQAHPRLCWTAQRRANQERIWGSNNDNYHAYR